MPITIISSKADSDCPSSSSKSEESDLSIIRDAGASLGSLTLFRFSCIVTSLCRLLVGEVGRSHSPNILDRRACVTNPRCSTALAIFASTLKSLALNFAVDSSSWDSDPRKAAKCCNVNSEGPGTGEMLGDSERRYHSSGTQSLKCRFEVDLKGLAEKGNSTRAEIFVVGGSRETSTTELD